MINLGRVSLGDSQTQALLQKERYFRKSLSLQAVNIAVCSMALAACHLMHGCTNPPSIFYAHVATILLHNSRISCGK